MKKQAVFLDRDGVINALAFNATTDKWESPHHPSDVKLLEGAAEAVRSLAGAGYLVFVVSNQPSYAKGKTSIENIMLVHEKVAAELSAAGARIEEFFYCYHYPSGNKPGYSKTCECRKPSPYFLLKAAEKYDLDLATSWLVGDRESDMKCGIAAGVKTVLVAGLQESNEKSAGSYAVCVRNLSEAAVYILKQKV